MQIKLDIVDDSMATAVFRLVAEGHNVKSSCINVFKFEKDGFSLLVDWPIGYASWGKSAIDDDKYRCMGEGYNLDHLVDLINDFSQGYVDKIEQFNWHMKYGEFNF